MKNSSLNGSLVMRRYGETYCVVVDLYVTEGAEV